MRKIRTNNPTWQSSRLSLLDPRVIAHNAGEGRLTTYPILPDVTKTYLKNIHERVEAWSDQYGPGSLPEEGPGSVEVEQAESLDSDVLPEMVGCIPVLGIDGTATIPDGTQQDVTEAVNVAMTYVRVRS